VNSRLVIPGISKNTVVLDTSPEHAGKMSLTEAAKKRAVQTNNVEVANRCFI
jgi:hypothetical protein